MFNITPLIDTFDELIQEVIDNKTKPLGALGGLEPLAFQLAKIQLTQQLSQHSPYENIEKTSDAITAFNFQHFKLTIKRPSLLVFAGDHGVAKQGVSIAPSEVTSQMVANFADGGAAINIFCQQFAWQLSVIDAGTLYENNASNIIKQRLGNITKPINIEPAMTIEQVGEGFLMAKKQVDDQIKAGCNVIAFGEMGIGNTTIASAIMAALMNIPASEAVGKGTGVADNIVNKKQRIIEEALTLHQQHLHDPWMLLACLSGYEIVQITGAMLAAAEHKVAIVVDGFISTAAAMVAIRINPNVKHYMIFSHCSGEQGHEKMLAWLNVKPLLHLDLRLGEGTGAALSLPLLQAAMRFFNDMASFSHADVTNVVNES